MTFFFDAQSGGGVTLATIKVYNGAAFVEKPLKIYNGSAFVTVDASKFKRYNGTTWEQVN